MVCIWVTRKVLQRAKLNDFAGVKPEVLTEVKSNIRMEIKPEIKLYGQ